MRKEEMAKEMDPERLKVKNKTHTHTHTVIHQSLSNMFAV